MSFILQYKKFLAPELRVPRSEIRPRNMYRISTYSTSSPPTKTGEDTRFVFVIGRTEDKLHCIKLNDIKPLDFTNFINTIRNKQYVIENDNRLENLIKKFSRDGKLLFETYIKQNPSIYSPKLSNYRTYFLKNITNVWEVRFEARFLRQLYGAGTTPTGRRDLIRNEQTKDISTQERVPFPTTPNDTPK